MLRALLRPGKRKEISSITAAVSRTSVSTNARSKKKFLRKTGLRIQGKNIRNLAARL